MPHDRPRKKNETSGRGVERPIRRILRENLRNRRLEIGLSQRQLGGLLDVSQQWIWFLETPDHVKIPSLFELEDLAQHLGTTPAELLTPGRFRGYADGDTDLRTKRSLVHG